MKLRSILLVSLAAALVATATLLRAQGGTDSATSTSALAAARAAFRASNAAEKRGSYEEAIKALQGAPKGYTLDVRLGWLNYLAHNYVAAETHYQAAMKDSPNSIEAQLGYLLPLLAEKRWAEADAAAHQITHTDPCNYYANLRLCYALRWEGKFDQAYANAARMSVLYPTDVNFLYEQAYAKIGLNQKSIAKKLFNDILNLDPDNKPAQQEAEKL